MVITLPAPLTIMNRRPITGVTVSKDILTQLRTKLFGGMIGWRANKQATVTTSTTEAELLALS